MRFAWYGPWLMMLLLLIEIEDCVRRYFFTFLWVAEPNKKKYGNVNEANDVSE